ncbi:DEKNAAC100997 [Brettanomyces naardenensis]|uniref:DEKNAAC100997 n=1 Tax=Brettanomyces naardenensis TaxID=13370 RepID=A0A448YH04_BRENA|nr:DEKNAAC100997 [Brettanomyces naardenensis]
MSSDKAAAVEVFQEVTSDENVSYSGKESKLGKPLGFVKNLLSKIQIDGTQGLSLSQLFLYNYDLKPVEELRRTWRAYNFIAFWIADSFNVNTFMIASTGVVAGLSWWSVWITVWLGYFCVACFIAASSRVGSYYHISFPVSCRSSFGIWGSLWPILNRVVMACVWFGVQSTIGGQCVQLMLKAIFGNSVEVRVHDTIHSDAITSFGLLSFFLFWIFQLPFIYMRPHIVRHLFTFKGIICPIAGFSFLIWTMVKAGGGGPVIKQKSTISGSTYAWAFINSTMNALANFSTLIVNAPDFTRMSKTKTSALWSQFFTIPISFSITCLIGILISSASTILYGETYWNPLDVLTRFLETEKSGSRAGVFFIAFGFAVAQIGTNISANSISAGTDMTALLPKYMNIRRGGFICAIVGFVICPWNLMTSSSMFTTYLSAYAVFLSSIAGVVFCDYFILKKGYLNLRELYIADNSSAYYSWKGINLRAYAAYICGILPNIVGFVGATKARVVPIGATYVYDLSYFTGYIAAAGTLLLINLVWPCRGLPEGKIFERKWLESWQDVEDFGEFFAEKRGDAEPVFSNPQDDFITG